MKTLTFQTHDEYLASVAPPARAMLKELRAAIRAAAPRAEEAISYNMPVYKLQGVLCYYAAFKEHVSLFPGNAQVIKIFGEKLRPYKTSKGTIQFPLGTKIPAALVKKIISYRVKQNSEKAAAKKKK